MRTNLHISFAAVRNGHWYWGLGDPDLGAVLVTGLYFMVAIACLLVGRLSRSAGPLNRPAATFSPSNGEKKNSGEDWAWYRLAAIMFCLGINKQADLQSLLTLYGRELLKQAGLYEIHRQIQVMFIIGVMLTAALTSLSALWLARRWSWACRFAAVGLGFQAAFIVIRAASFHHVDILLGTRLGQMKINLLFEPVGLILVLMAAMAAWARQRSRK